jgi:hypothetical protein
VAVGQGRHRRQIGLKAAGKEQKPLPAEPGSQLPLQLLMNGTAATHQPRGAGAETACGQFARRRRQHVGMATEAQVVIAGQIE